MLRSDGGPAGGEPTGADVCGGPEEADVVEECVRRGGFLGNNAGLSGSLRLYTAKVGAVPGPTMSTRMGSEVFILMAHLPAVAS